MKHSHNFLSVHVQLKDRKSSDQQCGIRGHFLFRGKCNMDNDFLGIVPQRLIQLFDVFEEQSDMGWTKVQTNLSHIEFKVQKVLLVGVIGTLIRMTDAKVQSMRD